MQPLHDYRSGMRDAICSLLFDKSHNVLAGAKTELREIRYRALSVSVDCWYDLPPCLWWGKVNQTNIGARSFKRHTWLACTLTCVDLKVECCIDVSFRSRRLRLRMHLMWTGTV